MVDPSPEDGEQAVEYFEQILDYAIKEGSYTHLVCTSNAYRPREVTFTDKEFICSVLLKLQSLEVSSIELTKVMTGAPPSIDFYLGYENGVMALCGITESTVSISYEMGMDNYYKAELKDPEIAIELFQMFEQQCAEDAIALEWQLGEKEESQ